MIKTSICALLCTLLSIAVTAQSKCSESKIIGTWEYVNSYGYNIDPGIDSLIRKVDNSTEVVGIMTYKADGKYAYKLLKHRYKSKGRFKLLEATCEIKYGRKQKLTSSILYLDDNYLIKKTTRHKGDIIYCYRRKKN
jgi:hypothetical protein